MSLNGLPEQFEDFISRARAALGREITKARDVVAASNAERSAAQNALSDLHAQCKLAQDQLAAVKSDFGRVAGLIGVGQDIEKARTELKRVKSETEQAKATLGKLSKERTEREAQLNALRGEVARLVQIRTESEAVMANIKMQLNSVQIGQRQ